MNYQFHLILKQRSTFFFLSLSPPLFSQSFLVFPSFLGNFSLILCFILLKIHEQNYQYQVYFNGKHQTFEFLLSLIIYGYKVCLYLHRQWLRFSDRIGWGWWTQIRFLLYVIKLFCKIKQADKINNKKPTILAAEGNII